MRAEIELRRNRNGAAETQSVASPRMHSKLSVALLTGGSMKPYIFGLATELVAKGAAVDLIGSDELNCPEFQGNPLLRFLNLRGDQRPDAGLPKKILRILQYYARLIRYAAGAKPKVFHVHWDNKFELLDRTLLLYYYKLLGKKIVLTVHNVNTRRRDRNDSAINRFSLRIQYQFADHMFVHTEKMKRELMEEFGVPAERITVIPFGINNAAPNTSLTSREARERLGLRDGEKVILFFGRIAPYKGLEYLVRAFKQVVARHQDYRLIIAGRPERHPAGYWTAIQQSILKEMNSGRVLLRADFIPDEETEVYLKAADVLAMPYRDIDQSGILFLGQSFGLPVLAADVGSLRDEIVEGGTGFMFRAEDPDDLATAIEKYFSSDLYANLAGRRQEIRRYATERHSWDIISQMTMRVYAGLLEVSSR